MTLEHVWPDWVLKILTARMKRLNLTPPNVEVSFDGNIRRTDKFDEKVKHVCARCNHTWMSDIENASRPFLEPMILGNGRPVPLSPTAQRILAIWAMKTALVVDVHLRTRRFPRVLYPGFFVIEYPRQV